MNNSDYQGNDFSMFCSSNVLYCSDVHIANEDTASHNKKKSYSPRETPLMIATKIMDHFSDS